jgi:SAM-dependent methyltransferase
VRHSGAEYWDRYFRHLRETGDDLDWGAQWVQPFLGPLRAVGARTLLELGCGTGNDAWRLADQGYQVAAIDVSMEAISWARSRFGSMVDFVLADIANPLPFPDAGFDAVMSNVALHMFADDATRAIFAEVGRVTRPGGLFVFHVNALEDRPLRVQRRPVARELEQDYVLEQSGQTVRFFSEPYLHRLLEGWAEVDTAFVEILDPDTGEPFKRVWRCIAHR